MARINFSIIEFDEGLRIQTLVRIAHRFPFADSYSAIIDTGAFDTIFPYDVWYSKKERRWFEIIGKSKEIDIAGHRFKAPIAIATFGIMGPEGAVELTMPIKLAPKNSIPPDLLLLGMDFLELGTFFCDAQKKLAYFDIRQKRWP
jgi:hypothetical protein